MGRRPGSVPWLPRAFGVGMGGAPAAGGEAQPLSGESPTFLGKSGTRAGTPWAAHGHVGLSARGGEVGAGTPQGDARTPAHPRLLHGPEPRGRCVRTEPSVPAGRWQCQGCWGCILRRMLWIQPTGPTPDVCPPAPAAAPTSPRFSPARESPSRPRWQRQQLRKRKRRPWHPPTAAWGVFWVWRKAEGSTGRAMPRSTQGMVVDRERGTPTPPRAPRSRPGDGERGSVSPEA